MSTTSISWNDVAGIVGGGAINPITGVLTVTHKIISDDDWINANIQKNNTDPNSYLYYLRDTDIDLNATPICSHLIDVGHVPSTEYGLRAVNQYGVIYINLLDLIGSNDTVSFKRYCKNNNVQLLVKLATPVTYQLTPTEIRSLLGVNNVWANCGSITELKYTRDLNLCINDIISRIEALESGSNTRSLSVSTTLTKSIVSDSDTTESKAEETEEETKEEAQNER